MPESSAPSTDIATTLLAASFAAAFLLLLIGSVVKYLSQTKSAVPIVIDDSESPLDQLPPPLPAGKVATWWCHRVDVLGLILMSTIFLFFALSQAAAQKAGITPPLTSSVLVANILVFAFLIAVVTIIVWWRVKPVEWLGLRWRQWPLFFCIGPAAVIVMWIIMGMLQQYGYIAWAENLVGSDSMQDAVKLLREGNDALTVSLMAFSAAIVAPIAEEVIFRGYLYPVAKHFAGRPIAIIATSLIFAAGHGNVPLLLPLFLLGILMACAYEWTGSLWAAISIHFFFNAATVSLQLAMRAGLFTLPETMP